jgi:hypothetical protein
MDGADGIILMILIGIIIFLGTLGASVDMVREDAIEAGVAEYYIDDDNEKAFRWITPTETKE